MTRVPGEFELIETYFAPLSAGEPGSFGLRNDAAVARVAAGQDVVITSDMLVAGVHFLDDDPANELSAKCLAVNLSDLAAMGARPTGYLLSICWPQAPEEHWIAAFVRGLADLQARYDMHLLGGDTTAGSAHLVICVTALGEVPQGLVHAALGLTVLQRQVNADGIGADGGSYLIGRYRLPEPRVALGRALAQRDLASACLDVSDGLLADAGHIAKASGLRLTLEQARVPLSQEAEVLLAQRPDLWPTVLTGGDDYELLFTAGADQASDLEALAVELDLPLTLIGRVEGGQGVGLVGTDGKSTEVGDGGWRHF
jgi:thiamine-monophosphate kinase